MEVEITNSNQLNDVTIRINRSSSNVFTQNLTSQDVPISQNLVRNIEINNDQSERTRRVPEIGAIAIRVPESTQPPPGSSNLTEKFAQWVENNSDRLLLTALVAYQATATVAGGITARRYLPLEDKSVRMTAGALAAYLAAPLASSFAAWATGHPRAATVLGVAPYAPIIAAGSYALSKIGHRGENLVQWIRDNSTGLIVTGVCMYQLSAAIGGAVAGNRYLKFDDPDVRMAVGGAAGYAVAPFASSFTAWMLGYPEAAAGMLIGPYVAPIMALKSN